MLGMKKAALAGVLALGTATTAQAVTFTPNVNDAFTFTFQWDDKDATDASHFFGIGFDFDLTIESVTGDNPLVGFFVEDSAGNLIDTPAMDSRCADGSPSGAGCELIFEAQYGGIDLLSGVAAGDYNFGIFASTAPAGGSITFGVSKIAAVPLPAGGLMLLGALGALGLKRRRKAA